jgi:uncharacterized protein (DUF2336 family)
MSLSPAIVDELESALSAGPTGRRIEVLRRITDLFVHNAGIFTEEQIVLFDDVMGRLVIEIENLALVELSARLAPIPNAPAGIIRRLAWDDAVEVAGPVLAKSDRLTDGELIELAKTKGQAHLAQIANRTALVEVVTDVLVERGESEVANMLAGNPGARFSETGLWQLVIRAEGDDRLSETIAGRCDIPPYLFRKILTQATGKVRQKLLASAQPDSRRVIEQVLAGISVKFRKAAISRDYAEARRNVRSLGQDTERIKSALPVFAEQKKLAELIAALSLLVAAPIEAVEQLVHDDDVFGLLVLCKAAALDWATMHAIILARPGADGSHLSELDSASATYLKLTASSAQRVFRFWLAYQKND